LHIEAGRPQHHHLNPKTKKHDSRAFHRYLPLFFIFFHEEQETMSDGHFLPGNPGGGRPLGSRNRSTRIAEEMISAKVETLIQRAIDTALADKGGGATLRALLKLILAEQKERNIVPFALPELRTPADAIEAMNVIAEALRLGELNQAETVALTKVVEAFVGAINLSNIGARLDKLEGKK
jgi:hypothetical protein